MNRKLPLLLSVFGCALGFAAGDAAAQAKHQLRWGHYLADGPFVQLEKDFVAAIEKRTNGQVKINITFAGGLGKGDELLMLTPRGAIDMTATAPGYNPDQLRYWRAFQTPLVFSDQQAGDDGARNVVQGVPGLRPGDGQGRRGVAVPAAARRVLPERVQPRVRHHGRASRARRSAASAPTSRRPSAPSARCR